MEIKINLLVLFFAASSAIHLVGAQDPSGFISLDCGLVPNDSSYSDDKTSLTYISDANFIDAGVSKSIKPEFQQKTYQQGQFLRSFPQGIRNCYQFNLIKQQRYLIRAAFLYGNYDDLNENPNFDIYIGQALWSSVYIQDPAKSTTIETIHVLISTRLHVCLVKVGSKTPFISALELRPLPNDTYNGISSLVSHGRVYPSTNTDGFIRFNEDVYDRIWMPIFSSDWTQISTIHTFKSYNSYKPPQLAMRTATVPANATQPLTFSLDLNNSDSQFYVYMHFAEIEELQVNESREFNVLYNGELSSGPFSPVYLEVTTMYTRSPLHFVAGKIEFSLEKTANSTHPPILNALEIYSTVDLSQLDTNQNDGNSPTFLNDVDCIMSIKATYGLHKSSWQGDPCFPEALVWEGLECRYLPPEPPRITNQNDVDCIMSIKATYGLHKSSWQGDPCFPEALVWEGLECRYLPPEPPRITSLNLSSSSLRGKITSDISNLTQLVVLDLSNNSLTGEIPVFLARMKYLKIINMSQNNLNGSIPPELLKRVKKGSLTLSISGNPNICATADLCNEMVRPTKKHSTLILIVSLVASVFGLVAGLTSILILKRRKTTQAKAGHHGLPLIIKNRRIISSDVLKMTNNFERELGKGGYGTVYHGYLDNTQVAVKILSKTSVQGYKEFKAEVELLLRVHHRNLVTLVGYCDKGDNLALVYEYMAKGNLKEHLLGDGSGHFLNWEEKLRIAADAAQGLEYLHTACKPAIVHRDVKTTNILLTESYRAKLGDFGLSRSLSIEDETHVSTAVAGTPGYLDPEYYKTNWLTEKSDVYSFGIVLLEIVTNQPVIQRSREKHHLIEWVEYMIDEGDTNNMIDSKLKGDFEPGSVSKMIEVAMACVNPSSSKRPTMSHVLMNLNECLEAEITRKRGSCEIELEEAIEVSAAFSIDSETEPR